MRDQLRDRVLGLLADRGFVIQRHPAARRQALLRRSRVDLVVDVGAATGEYGRELRRFGYRGAIVACEPMAAPFARLREAAAGDPGWTVLQVAAGEESGSAEINVASNSDSSSLLPMGERHLAAAPEVTYERTETIEVRRLDELVAESFPAADRPFLKVDTQGFEKQVLAGGSSFVERCVGLQLELSLVPLYDGGMRVDEAMDLVYGLGFHLVGFEKGLTDADGLLLQGDGVFARD